MLNNTPQKTQSVITVLGVQGRAQWEANHECLSLDFYVRTAEGVHLESVLLPHDCEDLGVRKPITDQHISGFFHNLDLHKEDLEGVVGLYNLSFSRGYIRIFPENCLPWFDNENQELNAFFSQTPFQDLLNEKFKTPIALKPVVEKLKPKIKDWIATPLLQSYLRGKALEMGIFWASKVGSCGSSGDGNADMIHLKLAIAKDAMAWFNSGRVPRYDTDYGVGHTLRNALRESGLEELAGSLPWKTWKHFDFSDAPTFSI